MFNKETPAMIFQWNQETFEGQTVIKIANRAVLEVAELYHAALNRDMDGVKSELADVAIMIWAVASANNIEVKLKPRMVTNCGEDQIPRLVLCFARLLCIDYTTYLFNISEVEAMEFNVAEVVEYSRSSLKLIDSIDHINSIAYALNINLPEIVDKKMVINRSRTWKKVGKDNYQHI